MAQASLIWFTIWSSIVHAPIMLVQALVDATERANLLGDIPALFLVTLVLCYLMPKGAKKLAEKLRAPKIRLGESEK